MRIYYKKSRISAKRSRKSREHWFKKGHTLNRRNQCVDETSSDYAESAPGISVPDETESSQEKRVTRLDKSLAADVRNAACCREGILLYKLRPAPLPTKTGNQDAKHNDKYTEKNSGIK